ncbi:TetR/AcrR family transcriptional regulator [Rhodococcus sp. IEGM1428]|uniref:TetR/AcrR family transcriptional regulator n=1 Tax=Rhodococcus sp. IEGM1428 TaxID=3392191 RepID=UPI003D11D8CC
MRPSKRSDILAAAARLVQREGIAAVRYDSIAAESGITKGGLVYHFPSREELITALHEYLAAQWDQAVAAATGKPADQATETERLEGYVRAATQGATRAELLFLLEGSTTSDHAAAWDAALTRWVPPAPTTVTDAVTAEAFVTRLAADGLWMYEALASSPLTPDFRRQIAELIADRIPDPPALERDHTTD